MDKLSVQVLRYIAETKSTTVSRGKILDSLGESAGKSLRYLEDEGFISSGKLPIGVDADHKLIMRSDGNYSITSQGLAFLEEKPGKDFDRWITRIVAIWGAITGTAAIIAEILLHFLQ